ncbi:23S rRNA (adenine(1618)-N(6))-methyltransferase RlmF [Vibrio cholerae]
MATHRKDSHPSTKRAPKTRNSASQSESKHRSSREMTFIKQPSKPGLHPRNKHQGRYDFAALVNALPALKPHVITTPAGDKSISFSDPTAVKLLNKALLVHHYQVSEWDIPKGYLCPPIPGRADYIHRLAELLETDVPEAKHASVHALDIGVGANCIYPIIGAVDYGWHYVGSDVDEVSVDNANQIASANAVLKGKIESRLQRDSRFVFKHIIAKGERYALTTCNPPFHKSLEEAQQGSEKKLANLSRNRTKKSNNKAAVVAANAPRHKTQQGSPILNFGGQKAELWCPGGEAAFVKKMAFESRDVASQVLWFSTLISKKENVRWLRKNLEKAGALEVRVVEMSQGQKVSRFMAWTFHDKAKRATWFDTKPR